MKDIIDWMPISFTPEHMQKNDAGLKIMTRRVEKKQPAKWAKFDHFDLMGRAIFSDGTQWGARYGVLGTGLWCKEAFKIYPTKGATYGDVMMGRKLTLEYRSDGATVDLEGGSATGNGIHVDYGSIAADYNPEFYDVWRPSIFMPRWAARHHLLNLGTTVERLQDISEADAIAEGIDWAACGHAYANTIGAFADLWDTINAKRGYAFESNPFVWVVRYKKIGQN